MPDEKRVLVVDDDANLLNLLKDYLPKIIKHELYVASTGEEALKIIEEKSPTAVLLDMQLPGIKGPQVLRIIREKYPKTKVLVITSYDKEVKDIVSKLGVDGFFPKPLVLNDVIARIEEILKAKEDTVIVPISLDDVSKIDGVEPKATILFIEDDPWMASLLPISDSDRNPDYPIERYGNYNYEFVYCQEEALLALKKFKPDIIICAAHVIEKLSFLSQPTSTANLIIKIMKSRYAPKAVIVHGKQKAVDSFNGKELVADPNMWVEKDNMLVFYESPEDSDKKSAERLNKMLWQICFKHNLVEKTK